jgi:hypothetical protein
MDVATIFLESLSSIELYCCSALSWKPPGIDTLDILTADRILQWVA